MMPSLLPITTHLLLLLLPIAALAQEAPPKVESSRTRRVQEKQPTQYVTFRLQHAQANDVSQMLKKLFFGSKQYADERTNTIIYAGPADTLADVQAMIDEVDRPAEGNTASQTAVIPVRHRNLGELATLLRNTISSRRLHVAVDYGRPGIVLAGSAQAIALASNILRQVDTAAGSAPLEFAFFHAQQGVEQEELEEEIPADLAEVARELQRFGAVKLLGRLLAVAAEYQEFKIEGSVAEDLTAMVRGELVSTRADGSVKVQLKAYLSLAKSLPAEEGDGTQQPGPSPSFELETVVQTKRGDYVVLGSAPTGWSAGESVLLVLHVRR